MQFKASVKAGKAPMFDGDLKFSDAPEKIEGNSSDDDDSLDEDSEGELVVKESKYPRFDRNAPVPCFELGMKFSSKQEFKQAIIEYGLNKRKEIKFVKDEGDRARAACSWPLCPWVCLLKKTSKFESWQVTSYIDEHICP
jgi:alpha-galactosidase